MKSFFRTVWGKLILVIVCTLSVLLTGACVLGASLTITVENGKIHLRPKEEIEPLSTESFFEIKAWHVLISQLNTGVIDYSYADNLNFRILNAESGNWLYKGQTGPSWEYHYRFYGYDGPGSYRVAFTKEEIPSEYRNHVIPYDVFVGVPDASYAYDYGNDWVNAAYRLGWWILAIGLSAFALVMVCYISLLRVSARRSGRDDLVPGPLHKLPFDLLLATCLAAFLGLAVLIDWILPIDYIAELYFTIGALVSGIIIFLGLSMSAAARVKTKTLIKNTLIFRILKYLVAKPLTWLWKGLKKIHAFNMSILRGLPLVGKTALFLGVLAIVELNVTAAADGGPLVLLSLIKYLILIPLVLYLALCLRRLQKGGEALAAGDLAYQTDTKGLPHDLKKHAEDLNSIGGGMAIAVREQLKSERMKTELITNVSHDLKTPLTSVINYADLIGKEPCENAKIKEYSGVLLRQSERLKRLIDDLVEASKASTGNLEVDLVPCDASVFLAQAAGEYEEKLRDAGLALVTKQPDEEVSIMADGRRMWRIFDNLMNNIVKYSLSGTRVYLSLEQADGDAVITFRNTSREPLDAVNTEELVERFTRGDASRNTEGSGLGLAIAKSLTELQGGKFLVLADGDLFKVILSFQKI